MSYWLFGNTLINRKSIHRFKTINSSVHYCEQKNLFAKPFFVSVFHNVIRKRKDIPVFAKIGIQNATLAGGVIGCTADLTLSPCAAVLPF